MTKNNFAERITVLIADLGITKSDLAKTVGVSDRTVTRWMSGQTMPTGRELITLSDEYGESVDWLLGRK